ncbi:carbon-nitrogen hydrolase family protein [Auraticoccus monumenti]|uniref:Predicted amidohydrolase n=1 Tax=Auraticoccus monumenti TaxID=675864 RepID=A0A1G7EYY7_9ACTN|nr:carbon-nitrogen hydrolase family protein [Auraticoccus monumenti]SDE68930.1 Predicted amidohydrolase [Auraticoccus monumenti]
MRLALAQCGPPPTEDAVEGSVAAVADAVARAGDQGAELVATSELVIGGYRTDLILRGDLPTVLQGPDDPRLDPVREAVRRAATTALVGAAVAGPDGTLNALLRVNPDGDVDVVHAKVHLWAEERRVFVPGPGPVVLEHAGLRIGLGICYDAAFPEYCRSLARDAHLLLFASAFAVGEEERRHTIYHPSRALESGVHVAVVNAVGEQGGATFFGRSQLIDPWGRRSVVAGDTPTVVVGDVDPEACRAARDELPYLQDLQPHYRPSTVGRNPS